MEMEAQGVQGVGFRYRACYIASSLGVTGWVEITGMTALR